MIDKAIKQVGELARQFRKEKNLTQAQLSELAKVSVRQISKLENGREDVSIHTIGRVFRALGCPARLILHENPSPSGDPWFNDPENIASVQRGVAEMKAGKGRAYTMDEIKLILDL